MCCQQPGNYSPICPLLLRNVFTLRVSTRQPVSICIEVTLVHHCFSIRQHYKLPQGTPTDTIFCVQGKT